MEEMQLLWEENGLLRKAIAVKKNGEGQARVVLYRKSFDKGLNRLCVTPDGAGTPQRGTSEEFEATAGTK